MPAEPVRERYTDVPRFVSVRGGAYFFLPGISAVRAIACGLNVNCGIKGGSGSVQGVRSSRMGDFERSHMMGGSTVDPRSDAATTPTTRRTLL